MSIYKEEQVLWILIFVKVGIYGNKLECLELVICFRKLLGIGLPVGDSGFCYTVVYLDHRLIELIIKCSQLVVILYYWDCISGSHFRRGLNSACLFRL